MEKKGKGHNMEKKGIQELVNRLALLKVSRHLTADRGLFPNACWKGSW